MINEYLVVLCSVSISGSVLFLVILLIDKLLKFYEVSWQQIVMKLLLFYFLAPAIVVPVLFFKQRQPEITYVNGEDIKMWISVVEGTENIIEKRWNWLSLFLLILWLTGFCLIFVRGAIRDSKTLKQLEILATLEDDQQINQSKDTIRKELNIQKNIDIYRTRLVTSPCICGILKPKIFFPDIVCSSEETEFLLRHELYHYKRHDVFYNMLISLFWGVHWFNPITWFFTAYLYNFCEVTCDQDVLKTCKQEQREKYANLLIQISGDMKGRKVYGLTSFKSQSEHFMQRRLYNIMKQKKCGKKAIAVGVICSLSLCPVVTYASTVGVAKTYDYLLNSVPYNEELGFFETNQEKMPENIPEQKIIRTEDTYFTIDSKGTNVVDFSIVANGKKETSTYVKKGGKILISLVGDTTDKFQVIISHNSEEKKVVSSSNGIVGINNYKADTSGTYKITIKNMMPSKTIHVSGSIRVSE